MAYHPNDRLAALEQAVKWATEQYEGNHDPLAALNLAVLRELRDEALREARK